MLEVTYRKISELTKYERNSRTHSAAQIEQIKNSINEFGFTNPILIDEHGLIIAGHGRLEAAKELSMEAVPTIMLHGLSDAQKKAYVIADNKLALNAGWDDAMLESELRILQNIDYDLSLLGFDDAELDVIFNGEIDFDIEGQEDENKYATDPEASGNMQKEFGHAPFSVFDSRRGDWLEKKRNWHSRIGDNGESREGTLMTGEMSTMIRDVSLLDPVMSEIIVSWFGKKDGVAFDPFAGDSVFGYVSSSLGMHFQGIELRKEQAELNQTRCRASGLNATYYNDTSENMDRYIQDESVDLVFSCPPYADLEVYSDNPMDLSTMNHDDFFKVYERILSKTYGKLKNNRFAVIVMGEVRNKEGNYICTIPNTIQIMERAGYNYYNEMILITPAGTLPLRAGKSMRATRKVGKMHQNILVFLKGDSRKAVSDLGDISVLMEDGGEHEQ